MAAWPQALLLQLTVTTCEMWKYPKKQDKNKLFIGWSQTHFGDFFTQWNRKWKWRSASPQLRENRRASHFPFRFNLGRTMVFSFQKRGGNTSESFQGCSCLEREEREQAQTSHWLITPTLQLNIWTLNVQHDSINCQTHPHILTCFSGSNRKAWVHFSVLNTA